MDSNEYSMELASFVESVLSPVEAFARLCMESCEEIQIANAPRGNFEDFGVVVGALACLSKKQLRDVVEKLQAQVGGIRVIFPRHEAMPSEIYRVILRGTDE